MVAHGVFVLVVGFVASTQDNDLTPPPTIPVEIVSPAQFEAAAAAASAVRIAPDTPVLEPVPARPAPAAVPFTAATNFFAAQILGDPDNRNVRRTLQSLERSERIVQLCSIEGLEQLRLARPPEVPDALVVYAFSDPTLTGYTLDAPSAAFRSDGKWYAVGLICSVGPDYETVTAFQFAVGDAIPKSEWAEHNLLAEEEHEDEL